MKTLRFLAVSVMVVIGLLFGIHSTCLAVPYVEVAIFDLIGGGSVLVQDQGPGDLNLTVGVVVMSSSIGNWVVNVVTGVTYPINGSPAVPWLDLNSINATSTGGGRLAVAIDAIGYTGPIAGGKTGPFHFDAGGTVGGGGGSIDLFALYSANNVLFGSGGGVLSQIGSLGTFTTGPFSGATDTIAINGTTSPFRLGIQAEINHLGAGTTSFDAELQGKIPEPISLILLGSGLAGAGLVRRWRKK